MKEIMNPKWEDADDCEDKMPIHKKQKLQIRNEKKEIWKMTNLHTTTTNITVPRSLAHPLVNFSLMSPKLFRTCPLLFLRLISWKCPLNQLKIHIFVTVKTIMSLLFKQKQTKRPKHLWKSPSLTIILIDWGGPFNFINHKDDGAIVFPWYFMWIIELWWHRWKNLLSINAIHKNSSQWNRSHYEVALCQKKEIFPKL